MSRLWQPTDSFGGFIGASTTLFWPDWNAAFIRIRKSRSRPSPSVPLLFSTIFRRQAVPVIPNGVNTAQFSPSARLAMREQARARRQFRLEDFVLLLIGNDLNNKGLPAVLEAMARQLEIPAKLIIVGDQPAPASANWPDGWVFSTDAPGNLPRRTYSTPTLPLTFTSVQAGRILSARPLQKRWPAASRS